MPLFLEPNQKFSIVLNSDKDKPQESRPTFFVKSLSMRGQSALSAAMTEVLDLATTQEIFDATSKLFYEQCSGWVNMGSFEHGCDLQEFLSHTELRELLNKILSNQYVQPEEKKS